jgi:hypothetical protein
MVMHPVGPLPASTYWRRRLVVLLVAVVVLLVLRSCAGSGSPRRTSAGSTPTPTTSSSPQATGPATSAVCADSALALTTTTDAATYATGATPKITLAVKNTSASACRRDLGGGAVELLVYSGADRVWSSDDCTPSKAVSVVTVPPGAVQTVVKTWSGVRSKPGCTGTKAQAKVGTYRVVARVGTLRVEGAVFRIHA